MSANPSETAAQDLRVSNGCATCGGDTAMRVGPSGAWAYCPRCHRLSRPMLLPTPNGPQLGELAAAA